VPIVAALVYACTTPLGIAVGLGIRTTYNPESAVASIVAGTLDATSAGILLWAGLVECLAHDFVFSAASASLSSFPLDHACRRRADVLALLRAQWPKRPTARYRSPFSSSFSARA